MIPTDEVFIERIAKAIARDRMECSVIEKMKKMTGLNIQSTSDFEANCDRVFEKLWNGSDEHDEFRRNSYRRDAVAAIRVINLKLMIDKQ